WTHRNRSRAYRGSCGSRHVVNANMKQPRQWQEVQADHQPEDGPDQPFRACPRAPPDSHRRDEKLEQHGPAQDAQDVTRLATGSPRDRTQLRALEPASPAQSHRAPYQPNDATDLNSRQHAELRAVEARGKLADAESDPESSGERQRHHPVGEPPKKL